jgi:transcriptional regulator with XRE-family HTH domain
MTEGEVLKLFRYANGYDNLDQLAEACGISKRSLSEQNGTYLSNRILRLLANAFDISVQALCISFRFLQDYDYNNKEERKKALMYVLSLSCNTK